MRNRLDPHAADRLARDEDAQQDAREAYLVQERSGMWLLRALLPPVAGAALCTALDPLAAAGAGRRPEPRTGDRRGNGWPTPCTGWPTCPWPLGRGSPAACPPAPGRRPGWS